MTRPRHALPLLLTVTMTLTLGLMMFAPTLAVKGSYPGRNGKIAFYVHGDEPSQIFVMNPDGTGAKQLTPPPPPTDDEHPAWSPDGSKIVFYVDYSPGPWGGQSIWVMNADGSNMNQIYSSRGRDLVDPAWSPDGQKIAFAISGQGIYVTNADGSGTPSQLTVGYDVAPHWSPDGTRILISRIQDQKSDIFVVSSSDGSIVQQLTFDGISSAPCWSPYGSRIVFARSSQSGSDIWVMNADGSGAHSLLVSGNHPNWSPDGTKIVFDVPGGSIYVMNADGTGATEVRSVGYEPDWQRLPLPTAVGGVVVDGDLFAIFPPWLVVIGLVGFMVTAVMVVKKRSL